MFSKKFVFAAVLAMGSLLHADTITDLSLGVQYTATSTFVPITGNTYDVFLNIDPTSFTAGSGFLTAVAMQFKTGSDVSTSATLVSAPGGASAWSLEEPGGLNSHGCNSTNPSSGDVCFQNSGANTPVPGGPYNFTFAVTMPAGDILTAASDIKVAYNTKADNSGTNLGLTSMGIIIQNIDPVPEPGTLGLLSAGLLGTAIILKKIRAISN